MMRISFIVGVCLFVTKREAREAPRRPDGPETCEPWSRWSVCSVTCGSGTRTRSRGRDRFQRAVEARRIPIRDCGGFRQTQICNSELSRCIPCVYSSWGAWVLSATCGPGVRRTRTRRVISQFGDLSNPCTPTTETNSVSLPRCPRPVNCVYSAYTTWSAWSATCGVATRSRTRRILVQGANGGILCDRNTLTATETIRGGICPTTNADCNGRPCSCRYCIAYTDPHFMSFDRTPFDYQGSCKHYLVKPCGTSWDSRYPRFEVLGKNPKCAAGNNQKRFWPSCVGSVELHIPGTERSQELTISIDATDTVRLNNVIVTGSQTVPRNGYFIDIYGNAASHNRRIETSFGLRITRTLDAENYGKVIIYMHAKLAGSLMGKTCGICGQHNYLPGDDDFTLPNGANYLRVPYLSYHLDYTYSLFFRVTPTTPRSCTESPLTPNYRRNRPQAALNIRKTKTDPVPAAMQGTTSKTKTDTSDKCAIINLADGPFSKCHHNEQRMILYNFCLNDLAVSGSFLCESLSAYAGICGQDGPTGDWRTQAGCPPLTCGQNAVYTTASHPDCMPTCYDPNPCGQDTMNPQLDKGEAYEEGCVCKKGFVYNGESCIDKRSCSAPVKGFGAKFQRCNNKIECIASSNETSTKNLCMGLYGLRKQKCFESFEKKIPREEKFPIS